MISMGKTPSFDQNLGETRMRKTRNHSNRLIVKNMKYAEDLQV